MQYCDERGPEIFPVHRNKSARLGSGRIDLENNLILIGMSPLPPVIPEAKQFGAGPIKNI
ncbi:MAG: hypothetical protein EBV97_02850 [Rhodobacteraceae bacterium]|nr:hypothetical protein [Paracoccaceae bacterium]